MLKNFVRCYKKNFQQSDQEIFTKNNVNYSKNI